MRRKRTEPKQKIIRVRISEAMLKKLHDRASRNDSNVSDVIRDSLDDYLLEKLGEDENIHVDVKYSPRDEGSVVKSFKISGEDKAVFEQIMAKNNTTWSGALHYLVLSIKERTKGSKLGVEAIGGYGNLSEVLYTDLMSMIKTYDMTYGDFMLEIDKLLTYGKIVYDNGQLSTVDSRLNVTEFIAKCDELGISDYQTMLDRIVKQIKIN